jgi:alpha-galactosidase
VDDTWQGQRDAQGRIHPNSRFPDMKGLADYVHAKGLKFGIYSSPGPKTCAGFEGSYGHEEQDAQTYAEWGVDFLKYDLCGLRTIMGIYNPQPDWQRANAIMREAYVKMHKALLKTGRPIVYSICQYGSDTVWEWAADAGGNLWRTTDDISDSFRSMALIGFSQAGLERYAGPGHWNDPDMLEVGNGGMTNVEYRSHFSLWAIMAAPLLIGTDLRSVKADALEILLNKEVIAVDQDPLGVQGKRVRDSGGVHVIVKPLQGGSRAVAVFNENDAEQSVAVSAAEIGLDKSATYRVRDLWEHHETTGDGSIKIRLPAHATVLYRIATQ